MGCCGSDQYRTYAESLPHSLWTRYVEDCRGRDPEMPVWRDSTIRRLRSSVFQILAEAGYLDTTRTQPEAPDGSYRPARFTGSRST